MAEKDKGKTKYLPVETIIVVKEHEKDSILEEQITMTDTLFDCYSKNKPITISYFENGAYHHYSGVIAKIDVLNEQIILLPRKKFNLQDISKITAKN